MPGSGSKLNALSDGLAELYAPASGEEWPLRALGAVARLIPPDTCSYNRFAGPTPLAWQVQPADVADFPDSGRLFRQHVREHPLLANHQGTGDGTARRISDFLSDRQFRSLGLYLEFYRHTGTRYQLAVGVPAGDGTLIAIALNRWHRDFTDDEVELADLLRIHLGQAASLAMLLSPPETAPAPDDPDGQPRLTARQARILQLVADGYPDRGIAHALGISTRTVQAHLQRAYRALNVTSRTEALAHLRMRWPEHPAQLAQGFPPSGGAWR
jgi:DNA-binding CsgD family transcriptional regulator